MIRDAANQGLTAEEIAAQFPTGTAAQTRRLIDRIREEALGTVRR
jgi:uncharacterized protein (DUF433 family)